MLKTCLLKYFKYLKSNKQKFYLYNILSFFVGLLELSGVALVYPFVLQILSKNKLDKTSILIGIAITLLFLIKNLFMIFYSYLQSKFTKTLEADLNLKFMEYFLQTSFQNSSQIPIAKKSNILFFLIPNFINNFVLRIMNLSINIIILSFITIFLVIKFPQATLVTIIFAALILIIQTSLFNKKLKKVSEELNNSSFNYTNTTNEIILNLKNIKISKNEIYFFSKYKNSLYAFFSGITKSQFYNSIPPYITEPCIIFLLFILLSIISIQNLNNTSNLIASFALITASIFRLAPTISRIQTNINGIRTSLNIVNELLTTYETLNINSTPPLIETQYTKFENKIEFKNIFFEYNKDKPILQNINFEISKNEFIGIIGLSGAGKTTLIDLLCGLLKPTKGKILIDNSTLGNKSLKISYIPQEFRNLNASIRENVAFGFDNIDDTKIIESLKKAQLYDFIKNNFKNEIYENPFIDNVGLSQGQKQRLAIARALYTNPDILILDEATSALDLKTEEEFCSVLEELRKNITIIAVAHKLTTIKNADKIIFLKDSKINDIGTFNYLKENNKEFANFANSHKSK